MEKLNPPLTPVCIIKYDLFIKGVSNTIVSYIVSDGTFISGKCTGKDVEGIGHITVSNNTTVSTLTPRSKENLHLH